LYAGNCSSASIYRSGTAAFCAIRSPDGAGELFLICRNKLHEKKMKIAVNRGTTISQINELLQKEFPNLKQFFIRDPAVDKNDPANWINAESNPLERFVPSMQACEIDVQVSATKEDISRQFEQGGMHVGLMKKHGFMWIGILDTDSRTLAELHTVSAKIEKQVRESDDYGEAMTERRNSADAAPIAE
jgi:hypothetical protein